MDPTAIRINGDLMTTHLNKRVSLIGRVVERQRDRAVVDAPDGKRITVLTNTPIDSANAYFEFIGVVVGADTIREEDRVDLGDSFDMEPYNELVQLIHSHFPKLFHA